MKYSKKFSTIILCVIFTVSYSLSKNIENSYTHNKFGNSIIIEAKTKHYENIEDLEKNAEIIVIAKKIKENDPTVIRADGQRISHIHTKSNFKVVKSFKGNLDVNSEFSILEIEGYDKKSNLTLHVAGYEMMKLGNEYILFLRKSKDSDDYLIFAINYGKTPLNENEEGKLTSTLRNINSTDSKEILNNKKF